MARASRRPARSGFTRSSSRTRSSVASLRRATTITESRPPDPSRVVHDRPAQPDASDPDTWELATLVGEQAFKTDDAGQVVIPVALKAGIYRATVETQDRFGKAGHRTSDDPGGRPGSQSIRRADRQLPRRTDMVCRAGRSHSRPCGAQATTRAGPMSRSNAGARSCGPGGRTRAGPRRSFASRSPRPCAADSPCASRTSARTGRI